MEGKQETSTYTSPVLRTQECPESNRIVIKMKIIDKGREQIKSIQKNQGFIRLIGENT